MNITQQHIISDSNTGLSHTEDLSSNSPWSRRNQNEFICPDVLPPQFESFDGSSYRPTKMLRQHHHEGSEIARGLSLNLQGCKQTDRRECNSEQGQGVLLCLNSHYPSEPSSSLLEYHEGDQWSGHQRNHTRSTVLQNSKYLCPARQLLDEVVCISNAAERQSLKPLKMVGGSRVLEFESLNLRYREAICLKGWSMADKDSRHLKITKLMELLKELEERYRKYCCRMNGVISSFESVAGTGAAEPYIRLTIQAMSLHFSNLREAIITQLEISQHKCSDQNVTKTHVSRKLGMIPSSQIWRPLRGLPENSVFILRTWLFEHFLHPYPNDNEKLILSSKTGLTRNQISNWFINARVRLWKPMIERMYREEFPEDHNDLNNSP